MDSSPRDFFSICVSTYKSFVPLFFCDVHYFYSHAPHFPTLAYGVDRPSDRSRWKISTTLSYLPTLSMIFFIFLQQIISNFGLH